MTQKFHKRGRRMSLDPRMCRCAEPELTFSLLRVNSLEKSPLDRSPRQRSGSVFVAGGRRTSVFRAFTFNKPDPEDERLKNIRPGFKGVELFRKAVQTVRMLRRILSTKEVSEGIKQMEKGHKDETESSGSPFVMFADSVGSDDTKTSSDPGLSFDPKIYKAKKEVTLSSEAKRVLKSRGDERTTEGLQTALYGLQTIPAFAEYPLHMQEKICKEAWLEEIPAKRVIIRQGHIAENFYFLISGNVIVDIMDIDPEEDNAQTRHVAVLRKGTSFGEMAFFRNKRRTATVISQTPVQLLVISANDFYEMFLPAYRMGEEEPEHVKFLRQVEFLENWPLERLVANPDNCMFQYFTRGKVIVKNSSQSEWIYIIKSGTCQVLKQLRPVRPCLRGKPLVFAGDIILPTLGPKIDTGRGIHVTRPVTDDVTGVTFLSEPKRTNWREEVMAKRKEGTVGLKVTQADVTPVESGPNTADQPKDEGEKERPKSTGSPVKKTVHLKTTQSFLRRKTQPKPPPVFVQIDLLHEKDVFGLTMLRFDSGIDVKQPSVSLVSKGAECIMISKKFFLEHANEKVKAFLRKNMRPYPSQDSLQGNLQDYTNWAFFKDETVNDILGRKAQL
ncbi:CNBD2 [Branchiostoma lanceolatum]|uniref:CNBD2 protein n=1 Tax=Branchiostoma lanceolatum TaxID=7740 RepID=A0A8K0A0D7_BRALA|nr:CNBD2 [Branchiostoma lanceolatum]